MTEPGRGVWRLLAIFGLLAFLQGVIEPTEGLLAQPVRSRLLGWGRGPGEIAWFAAVLTVPWVFKPLLGVLTDAVPLWGSRRRLYIAVAGVIAALAFLTLAVVPAAGGSPSRLLAGLLVASLAVTLSDVATDALVVDRGRADGQTGRYQAAQWFCLYASGIVTGTAGGIFSAGRWANEALWVCALAALAMLVVATISPQEPASTRVRGSLRRAGWSPRILAVGGFLALGNFNPFASSAVLQVHLTGELGLSESFFGITMSILAAASMVGAVAYGVYGPRVPLRPLASASVALGIVSNLVYVGVSGPRSAVLVTILVGLSSMSATLIQVELAAQACPPGAAATVFASFMAISNLSAALATWLGGVWYEIAGTTWGRPAAFQTLVVASSAFLMLGGLLVPFLPGERITEA